MCRGRHSRGRAQTGTQPVHPSSANGRLQAGAGATLFASYFLQLSARQALLDTACIRTGCNTCTGCRTAPQRKGFGSAVNLCVQTAKASPPTCSTHIHLDSTASTLDSTLAGQPGVQTSIQPGWPGILWWPCCGLLPAFMDVCASDGVRRDGAQLWVKLSPQSRFFCLQDCSGSAAIPTSSAHTHPTLQGNNASVCAGECSGPIFIHRHVAPCCDDAGLIDAVSLPVCCPMPHYARLLAYAGSLVPHLST